MEIVIRKANLGDLERLIEIQKEAFAFQARKYDAWDIPPMVEKANDINLDDPGLTVLVAEADGVLLGSIRLLKDGTEAEIKRLSVSKGFQNNGIGSKLMKSIEENAEDIKRLWLFTGGQSYKNINLYRKMGYDSYKEEPFKDEFTLIYMEKYI